jgi:hypothetical protein
MLNSNGTDMLFLKLRSGNLLFEDGGRLAADTSGGECTDFFQLFSDRRK